LGLVAIMVLVRWQAAVRDDAKSEGLRVTPFEVAWALLAVIASTSVILQASNVGYSARLAVDSFWLPLIVYHAALHHLDWRGRGGMLLLAGSMLALFLFATGAFEFISGVNVLPWEGSALVREREIRVNGPFASDSSYAVICLVLAVFLRAGPRLLGVRLDATARLLHACSVAAAALASMLPLYRVVVGALIAAWLVIEFAMAEGSKRKLLVRATAGAAAVVVTVVAFDVVLGSPIGRRLASARNLYGRVATWEAAVRIASDEPLFGVGLGNYTGYFETRFPQSGGRIDSIADARAEAYPHSNLLWIASELGLVGLSLYLLANLHLFLTGYRGLKLGGARRRAAAACCMAMAVAYWTAGITLTSGAYSDLNLCFFFLLGVVTAACRR
jgi:hypothetical protein